LLQELLARPAEAPQPKARKRRVVTGAHIQRWLVALVLILVVASILALPAWGVRVPTLTQPIESGGATRLYNTVQDMQAGDTVMVAFEYGPSEADELNLVAEPILRHLLDQDAHIYAVSTNAEGSGVAARLLKDIVEESKGQYTEAQYTMMGYRSGGATAVSQLLADADIQANVQHGVVLVLTAQSGSLRWWIEQSQLQAWGGDDPTVVAGLSASLEPAASPYLDANAGQLKGAVSGLSGASAYEKLRGSSQPVTLELNALAAGHVAVVGLMLLGAVFYTLGGLRRRQQ